MKSPSGQPDKQVCLLVFDLDDTLMDTAVVYFKAIDEACRYMMSNAVFGDQSPTLAKLKQKQLEIDAALRTKIDPNTKKPYYYSRDRFPLSLVNTYKYFCKELGIETDHMVEKKLFKIGESVYLKVGEYAKYFKPEAAKVLSFLYEKGNILMLLTKGDRSVQSRKIRAMERLGLKKFFTKIRVVKDKNQGIFRKLRKGHSDKLLFSVGNEYPSDIEPAIKEGFFGVYIPSLAVWEKGKMEKIEEMRDKCHSNRYDDLLEIKRKYEYLILASVKHTA